MRKEVTSAVDEDRPNLRLTHKNLWWQVVIFAIANIALGLNFVLGKAGLWPSPTFPLWGTSFYVWGGTFIALGVSKLVFLFVNRLHLVRAAMGCEIGYMLFLAVGALEPFKDDKGSLQLPIVYAAFAALEFRLMLEAWSAKRDANDSHLG